ncbi:MAG: calcium/sodium antiporter [Anaerolineae bacterium]|nr:calcium/sodium antiporter [Anaerolineae bacterium]MCO5194219.1 calcium/sodium antiporter [Anaerolineae bacterium]MCO5198922.1 calcium/sodium antiporter [Anaerolineae bacterium]
MWVEFLILTVCVIGLWLGGSWIVDSAARIARRIGMSELVIGLTIVAIGTSAPEFAVTIAAALNGQSDISVANVVGSNIFNLGFILGGVALVAGIPTTRKLVWRDGMMLIGATVMLLVFMLDLRLSWWEGAIMLATLIVYVSYLIIKRDRSDSADEIPAGHFSFRDIPLLIGGIALIIVSGHYLVESAIVIARFFGVSEWVIGVTIVAAGTSAPELATSLVGVLRGRHAISVGNLIGSDLFNLLGVLGLAAMISSLTVGEAAYGSLIVLCGLVIVVVILMRTGWRLTRLEGGLLVGVNAIRWIADFI